MTKKIVLALAALITLAPAAQAGDGLTTFVAQGDGTEECTNSINNYNSVIQDVADTLKRYSNCISTSRRE